jgi:Ca2+-binding EF-hand superfamily protein
MNDEQAAEYIKNFDNNGNGKIEFSGMSLPFRAGNMAY